MPTCAPVEFDPKQVWQDQAFAALEDTFGFPMRLWFRNQDETWTFQEGVCDDPTHLSVLDYEQLFDAVAKQSSPLTAEISPGYHLLAIPLGETISSLFTIATCEFETDAPELLLNTAKIAQHYYTQQKQMVQLRDENEYFLKQVSDDFEELSLLRSMAQELGLGEERQDFSQLVANSLPILGEAVNTKFLHYVESSSTGVPQIEATWTEPEYVQDLVKHNVLEALVEHFCDAALKQTVIKNDFQTTEEGRLFPGIKNFVLTSISTSMREVGWFLAVNRICTRDIASDPMQWRLSQHEFGTSEASLLSTAAAMLASHANNLSLFREREELLVNVVKTLVSAVEAKDRYTCGHSERVALYAKRLALQVGYNEQQCELLYLTGLLHDVGKIAVSDAVLNKPDQLTEEEFAEIQRHPDEGWAILRELEQLSYVLPGVLHHHERTDGRGYPDGLSGEEIPLDGRVLAVADAYDAMTSDRAYRRGMPHEKAVGILREGAGTQWDPEIVEAFFEAIHDIVEIRESYQLRQRAERQTSDSENAPASIR